MAAQTLWLVHFPANLSHRVQAKLLPLSESFRYAEGVTIFREGDPSLYLYIVKTGRVAVEIHVCKGSRLLLTLGPGEVFSWSALVEPRIETASARALEPTEVMAIKGGALRDLCLQDPELGFELYRGLAEVLSVRLNATRQQLAAWAREKEGQDPTPADRPKFVDLYVLTRDQEAS